MASRRKKKNTSPIRQEYLKQRRRLGYYVTQLRKKGYDVSISDIAGAMPSRATRQRTKKLSEIRSIEAALKQYQKTKRAEQRSQKRAQKAAQPKAPQPSVSVTIPAVPSMADVIIENFHDDISRYHPITVLAIKRWERTLIDLYGKEAFTQALQWAAEEGYSLSDSYGYLIPPGDLELYLLQVVHMLSVDTNAPDLSDAMSAVEDVISDYEYYFEMHGISGYER